ncbi:MAG: hypothetical protein SFW09_07765 [Hyphomicrobiaceae bacterium]|nr:hypothetical protein [Hyphomicrobiaceae bacterium]
MIRQEIESGRPAADAVETRRLAGLVLVRVATGSGGEDEVARDLFPLVPGRTSPEIWRIEVARLVAALAAGGLVERVGPTLWATQSGIAAAVEFLGAAKGLPASWPLARDRALMARALGLEAAPARTQRLLAKADGLRALIAMCHYGLAVKGAPSPSRLRAALAVKALERAFGNRIQNGLGDEASLPAKAGRQLAGQLSATPRDFGTDARLVAALAAEAVGACRPDLKSLGLAVLRRFISGSAEPQPAAKARPRRSGRRRPLGSRARPSGRGVRAGGTADVAARAATADVSSLGDADRRAPPSSDLRPDPRSFAVVVNDAAGSVAEGWPGNRKAFISRVWGAVFVRHPEWALTEIEFKCMLAEAHRTGLVTLANADLKDKHLLEDLQDSAVVYKNTVWHYVRVLD